MKLTSATTRVKGEAGDRRSMQLRAGLQEFLPGSAPALRAAATRVILENITAE